MTTTTKVLLGLGAAVGTVLLYNYYQKSKEKKGDGTSKFSGCNGCGSMNADGSKAVAGSIAAQKGRACPPGYVISPNGNWCEPKAGTGIGMPKGNY